MFLLENANVDSSQRNVVFIVNAEKAIDVVATAGMLISTMSKILLFQTHLVKTHFSFKGLKVDNADTFTLFVVSLVP